MAGLSDGLTSPDALLRVANLAVPLKPAGAARVHPDPFSSSEAVARALGLERVKGRQIESLRALHAIVVELVDRLLAGRPVTRQAAGLSRAAGASVARAQLEVDEDGALRAGLDWSDPDPAAALARRLIAELGAIDLGRLRRCARPECDLLFYDSTRSGTRRWHAESPCGIRERQRRHRARGRSRGRSAGSGTA